MESYVLGVPHKAALGQLDVVGLIDVQIDCLNRNGSQELIDIGGYDLNANDVVSSVGKSDTDGKRVRVHARREVVCKTWW